MTPSCSLSPRSRLAAAVWALLALSGCASLQPDAGFGVVEQQAKDRLGKEVAWARTDRDRAALDARVADLLAAPLSADAAVQIALLNNRGLQASFDQLGIADADRVQASVLPNPGFSFGRLRQGSGTEIDRSITFNLAHLLSLPLARQIERQRFEATRGAALMSVLTLASQTRKAYYLAVAADETVRYSLTRTRHERADQSHLRPRSRTHAESQRTFHGSVLHLRDRLAVVGSACGCTT